MDFEQGTESLLGPPFKVYMSPIGSNSNDGRSATTPVKSLWRVEDILLAANFDEASWADTNDQDVEVHIDPNNGRYFNQMMTDWDATNPNYVITFMSKDGSSVLPIFDGCTTISHTSCFLEYFFTVSKPGPTNVYFSYIRVERYGNGIQFEGLLTNPNSGNRISNCDFRLIGSTHTTSESGWDYPFGLYSVELDSSEHNYIMDNMFDRANNTTGWTHLHHLYIADRSDYNVIIGNTMKDSHGPVMKFRNESNYNIIEGNTFIKSSMPINEGAPPVAAAAYYDNYSTGEKSSCGNDFGYNILDGRWDCAAPLTAAAFKPAGNTCGGVPRVNVYGNTTTSTPCTYD